MSFVGVLIGLLLMRHFLLTPWVGPFIGDLLILVLLFTFVIIGSRFVVRKLELRSNLKSSFLVVSLWTLLSVISDLTFHRFFTAEDWHRIFGSSILVQADFWMVLIFCEIVGPFLVIWIIKSE